MADWIDDSTSTKVHRMWVFFNAKRLFFLCVSAGKDKNFFTTENTELTEKGKE